MSDPEPLVTVATYDSLLQAEMARGFLDGEGIQSFVADGELVNMAWYMSGAVGGVKLQVARADFWTAERLLNQMKARRGSQPLDDYGFAKGDAITADPGVIRDEVLPGDEEDDDFKENQAEAAVSAALRAAILGLVLLPPLLHLYSLSLLGSVKEMRDPLRGQSRKKFKVALTIDIAVLVLVSAIVLLFFASVILARLD